MCHSCANVVWNEKKIPILIKHALSCSILSQIKLEQWKEELAWQCYSSIQFWFGCRVSDQACREPRLIHFRKQQFYVMGFVNELIFNIVISNNDGSTRLASRRTQTSCLLSIFRSELTGIINSDGEEEV